MLPLSSRALLRQAPRSQTFKSRRLLSTAPPHQKSRSWKSSAVRWGIAVGGLYYYNTSSVFAEEPPFSPSLAHPTTPEETSYPTLDSIAPTRRPKPSTASPTTIAEQTSGAFDDPRPAGLEETEEEASQEGAFNEETGEINWDCPCLGGMAHGPCGEQFREAFSCFVYSKEEPKGMDCIDRFKGMQDCFREHPDVYGDELADPGPPEDDDEPAIAGVVDAAVEGFAEDAPISTMATSASALAQPSESSNPASESKSGARTPPPESLSSTSPPDTNIHPAHTTDDNDAAKRERAKKATEQVKQDHGPGGEEKLVPKEWHDARQKNDAK